MMKLHVFAIAPNVAKVRCTLQGALQFARFADLDVLTNFPRLRSWCERFRQRSTVEGVIFS
jgi:hypothetical protein